MKQNLLPNLRTAFLCIFFLSAAGLSAALFTDSKERPQQMAQQTPYGLEISGLRR